jgi:hypothetical protein
MCARICVERRCKIHAIQVEPVTELSICRFGPLKGPEKEGNRWFVPCDVNSNQFAPARKVLQEVKTEGHNVVQGVLVYNIVPKVKIKGATVYTWEYRWAEKAAVGTAWFSKLVGRVVGLVLILAWWALRAAVAIGGFVAIAALSVVCSGLSSDPRAYAVLSTGEWVFLAEW